MKESTRERLLRLAEAEYKKFSASLVPGEEFMLGVRLPKLRETAKELAKGNWKEELKEQDVYFEETMLRGMVLSYATVSMDPENAFSYIRDFIPLVRNWSVCDSVFLKMDVFKKDPDKTWEFLIPYLNSGKEFEVRVALISMMGHLLRLGSEGNVIRRVRKITSEDLLRIEEEEKKAGKYLDCIFKVIDRPFEEGYYAMMAAAWLLAEAFCFFPALTDRFLKSCNLDDVTYNKALQKITESRIPENKVKEYIKSCRRCGIKAGGK